MVRLIREQCPLCVIAEETGVSLRTVQYIRRSEGLRHVQPDPSPKAIARQCRLIRKNRVPLKGKTGHANSALALGVGIVSRPPLSVSPDIPVSFRVDFRNLWDNKEGGGI